LRKPNPPSAGFGAAATMAARPMMGGRGRRFVAGVEPVAVATTAFLTSLVFAIVGKAHPAMVLAVSAKQFTLISAPQPALVSMPIVGTHPDAGKRARLRHQR